MRVTADFRTCDQHVRLVKNGLFRTLYRHKAKIGFAVYHYYSGHRFEFLTSPTSSKFADSLKFWMKGLERSPFWEIVSRSSSQEITLPVQKDFKSWLSSRWIAGSLPLGMKWPWCEADHKHPSSAEGKNEWATPRLLHMPSWCAQVNPIFMTMCNNFFIGS